jgi:hypothetical protein
MRKSIEDPFPLVIGLCREYKQQIPELAIAELAHKSNVNVLIA